MSGGMHYKGEAYCVSLYKIGEAALYLRLHAATRTAEVVRIEADLDPALPKGRHFRSFRPSRIPSEEKQQEQEAYSASEWQSMKDAHPNRAGLTGVLFNMNREGGRGLFRKGLLSGFSQGRLLSFPFQLGLLRI